MLSRFRIGTRIQIGFTLVLILSLAVITPVVLHKFNGVVGTAERNALVNQYKTLNAEIHNDGRVSAMLSVLMAQIPDLQQAMATGDRARIGKMLIPAFKALKKNYGVVQMQFHTPPAISFFRVHKPEKYGDDLSSFRHTVVEANTTLKPVTGLEKGVAGLGIRGVIPMFYKGKHIGSVEVGMSFGEPFFKQFKKNYGIDLIFKLAKGDGFTTFATTMGDAAPLSTAELKDVMGGTPLVRRIDFHGRPYAVYADTITDYSGKPIGVVELAMDSSSFIDAIASARDTTLLIGLVALLLGVLLAWLISRTITHPICATAEALAGIADGDGDLTQRLDAAGGDELALLANGFNRFTAKIQEVVRQVVATSGQLREATDRMNRITDETGRAIDEQQSETEQVATAINEMAATVQEVARSAAAAAEAATTADKQTAHGRQEVLQTVQAIDSLAGDVEQASSAMQQLETDSRNISAVLDVIRGVAEQTNLLALNAAIEAARAGEQGRGFAVVADEVRVLAQRTQQSTQEIEAMIAQLQKAAVNTARIMEQGHERAQETVTQARSAGESLDAIAGAVGVISDMNTQIASAVEEQSTVAEELNKNIANISNIAELTSEESHHTAAASHDIRKLADTLDGLVGRFRV